MGSCFLYFQLCQSALGIFFGASAFMVFLCKYNATEASIWALISGIFAAVCFQLHYLEYKGKLDSYHSPDTLDKLIILGFVVMTSAASFFTWYIFATFYYHIPMVPVEASTVICAVWTFMTAKWGLNLYLACSKYRRQIIIRNI